MATGENRLWRWVRFALATIAIAFGLLAMWSGLAASEPIRIGFGKGYFYQLVATPPTLWWLWGILGMAAGILLAFPPLIKHGKR